MLCTCWDKLVVVVVGCEILRDLRIAFMECHIIRSITRFDPATYTLALKVT